MSSKSKYWYAVHVPGWRQQTCLTLKEVASALAFIYREEKDEAKVREIRVVRHKENSL